MPGIQVSESSKPKARAKVLKHLEIQAQLGGGHIVRHVYTDYQHEPKDVKFNKEGKSQGGEHIVAHLTKHAGLPAGSTGEAGEHEAKDEDEASE
jgi:hypothetical protein